MASFQPVLPGITPEQALEIAKGAARTRQAAMTVHALQKMRERNVHANDVRSAILTATTITWRDDDESWRLEGGTDIDGDPLTVALTINGAQVRVVTVF